MREFHATSFWTLRGADSLHSKLRSVMAQAHADPCLLRAAHGVLEKLLVRRQDGPLSGAREIG